MVFCVSVLAVSIYYCVGLCTLASTSVFSTESSGLKPVDKRKEAEIEMKIEAPPNAASHIPLDPPAAPTAGSSLEKAKKNLNETTVSIYDAAFADIIQSKEVL